MTRSAALSCDAAGQVTQSSTAPDGVTLDLAYDPRGRLLSVTDTLGQRQEYGYDAAGNLIGAQVRIFR
ncbi:hypothetical protein [Immundisolibacter sp.]|uniref:hypothetical protein n=1 Tax=Immundisolibacter sp. TaxID=1934948 RepID=UPI003564BA3B